MLSTFGNWLLLAPLWEIGMVILLGMVVASLTGHVLRARYNRQSAPSKDISDEDHDEQIVMVSAIMGLQALLFAFTFSIALDRFDARRVYVLDEANAIGTTYLRAQLLEEPHRARMSNLLKEYVNTRIELATLSAGAGQSAVLKSNDQLIVDLWTATIAAFPSMRSYFFSNSFLETMNELINMDAARKTARQAHVPAAVFLVLFLYQFTAAGFIGYVLDRPGGRRTGRILLLLFGGMLVLIVDVDRPTTGAVRESQSAMIELKAFIDANQPSVFDRMNAPVDSPGHK